MGLVVANGDPVWHDWPLCNSRTTPRPFQRLLTELLCDNAHFTAPTALYPCRKSLTVAFASYFFLPHLCMLFPRRLDRPFPLAAPGSEARLFAPRFHCTITRVTIV